MRVFCLFFKNQINKINIGLLEFNMNFSHFLFKVIKTRQSFVKITQKIYENYEMSLVVIVDELMKEKIIKSQNQTRFNQNIDYSENGKNTLMSNQSGLTISQIPLTKIQIKILRWRVFKSTQKWKSSNIQFRSISIQKRNEI